MFLHKDLIFILKKLSKEVIDKTFIDLKTTKKRETKLILLLDYEGIKAPLCVSHDCINNIPLQKRKFQDLIPFKKKESS